MKKINSIILLLTLCFTNVYANIPGKDDTLYAGTVTYKVTYDFLPGVMRDEERINKQAKEAEMIFRGSQSKFSQAGMELKQERYSNGYDRSVVDVLYVYEGEGKAGKFGESYGAIRKEFRDVQIELAKTPPPQVNFTNETKVIQGLTCKKAEVKTWDEFGFENNAEVFYYEHPDLENLYFSTEFRSIKGLLMEYEFVSQGIIVKFEATEFKQKKKIKDDEFALPENLEFFTLEELNNINQRGYE